MTTTIQEKTFKYTSRYTKEMIDELLEMKEKLGLTAENFVNMASNKKSNWHHMFNWDDKDCATKYRQQQARVFLNEIKLIIEDKEIFAFENITVNVEETSTRQYFDAVEIMEDEDMRADVIRKAFAQIVYWKDKYQEYREFEPLVREINKLQYKIK